MLLYCKKNICIFEENKYYNVYADIHSVFVDSDFISIEDKSNNVTDERFRFRLNKSSTCIEGYIGEYELYFFDYFDDVKKQRKEKLEKLK